MRANVVLARIRRASIVVIALAGGGASLSPLAGAGEIRPGLRVGKSGSSANKDLAIMFPWRNRVIGDRIVTRAVFNDECLSAVDANAEPAVSRHGVCFKAIGASAGANTALGGPGTIAVADIFNHATISRRGNPIASIGFGKAVKDGAVIAHNDACTAIICDAAEINHRAAADAYSAPAIFAGENTFDLAFFYIWEVNTGSNTSRYFSIANNYPAQSGAGRADPSVTAGYRKSIKINGHPADSDDNAILP